tara:strand:+ start:2593 stop:2796 length:204 start_codon:yes stop_codon:yes gene_type:complete
MVSGLPVFSVGSVFWALTHERALNDNIAVVNSECDCRLSEGDLIVAFEKDECVFGFVKHDTGATDQC